MKSIKSLLIVVLTIISTAVFSQSKTGSFKVAGNCEMCKKRIESAVKVAGVTAAAWNVNSKVMTITFDDSKISLDSLQKSIANAGYSTEKYTASEPAYKKLPECCQYERNEISSPKDQQEKPEGNNHK